VFHFSEKRVVLCAVAGGGAGNADADTMEDKGATLERPFPTPSPVASLLSAHEYELQQSSLKVLKAELKLAAHDRESLKKELQRVSTERDGAYKQLALASGGSSMDNGNSSGMNGDQLIFLVGKIHWPTLSTFKKSKEKFINNYHFHFGMCWFFREIKTKKSASPVKFAK
jgi:hypothetical protein